MFPAVFNANQVPQRRDTRQQVRERNMSGYSAIGADPRGDNQARETLRIYGSQLAPAGLSRSQFQAGLEGDFQDVVNRLMDRFQNRNYQQTAQRMQAFNTRQAKEQSRNNQLAAQELGLGSGFQGGQFGQTMTDLQRQNANIGLHYNDPARQEEDMLALLQLLQGVQSSNPYAEFFMGLNPQLFAAEQYKAQQRSQRGIGGALGNLLGGMNLGNLLPATRSAATGGDLTGLGGQGINNYGNYA